MYREYFGLQLKPFSITPDPRFLYMSPGHKEALAHLLYGLKEASGFVVITGEVGTGKTTILNAFILKLPPRMPKVVVKNPHLKPENLYFLLGEAISIPEEKRSRDYLNDYEERLKELGGAVLIVDESQGLSVEMLEEIRLLSNMETINEKLVQIMLLGQQELNEKLKSPHLRQLKQRIGIKYHIPPLDNNETKDYIDHRLRVAGYEPKEKPLFTVSALTEIYRYSKGYPRLINILCDTVLLNAYTENLKQINAPLVRKAVSDLESTYQVKKGTKPASQFMAMRGEMTRIWLKRAGAVLVILGVLGFGWFLIQGNGGKLLSVQDSSSKKMTIVHEPSSTSPAAEALSETVLPARRADTQELKFGDEKDKAQPVIPPSLEKPASNKTKGTVVTINEGDTVAKLAADFYGRIDEGILKAVKAANPDLPNMDLVYKGQRINLPQLGVSAEQVLYSVSVASYHSMNEAKAVFSDLITKGYQATIYPYLDSQQKSWYRITIGTFTSRQDAIDYTKQLRSSGFPDAKPVKISMEE